MEPETGLIQDAINHANGSNDGKKKSVSPTPRAANKKDHTPNVKGKEEGMVAK